jgi:membrane fusion protein, copper/silver efflux system
MPQSLRREVQRQSPQSLRPMKKLLILILILAAAAGGWWFGHSGRSSTAPPVPERKVLYYQSPMHPWIKSDKPGRCTICGMELSPVYEGSEGFDTDASVVTLSKSGITAAAVETTPVIRQQIRRTVRVAGIIDDDDTAHRRISATVDGRIEKLFVNYLGAEVTAGEPLATLYSPMLRTAFAEFQTVAQQQPSPQREGLLAGVRDRLLRLGMAPADIDALRNKSSLPSELQVLAPASGTVVKRNVYPGQYVKEGEVLFEIGDFSKMWFVFDAYERDLTHIRMGDPVEISTPALPGRIIKAPITFIDPTLDETTRSAKIRVVVDNPVQNDPRKHRHELLHKLYAEGRIQTTSQPVLTVPREAVLWPRGVPVVYVEKEKGAYRPREIRVGLAGDDVWEVLDGLREGEKVVTSGNLLLDGQSQIERPAETLMQTGPAMQLTKTQQSAAEAFFAAESATAEVLASEKFAEWPQATAKLHASVDALSGEFGVIVESIKKAAQFSAVADLQAARSAFYPLGDAAADFALHLRAMHPAFAKLLVFECAMAKDAVPSAPREEGRWVQIAGPIRNPYFGPKMLTCGSELKP